MENFEKLLEERIEQLKVSKEASYNEYHRIECEEKILFLRKLKDALFGF
ncbi:MAG: hypothetical protein WCT51_04870 [Candidatus Shapirobacteria bacterium]|jgi:hypothetical protein